MAKKNSQLPSTSEQILERSTTGATFLMMGQLFTKLVTFILNNLLIRFLSPRIFGITAFLEFIQGTVLFFSRDAIRLSTLRISDSGNGIIDDDDEEEYQETHYKSKVLQTAVNFAYIPFWIGFPLSIWSYRLAVQKHQRVFHHSSILQVVDFSYLAEYHRGAVKRAILHRQPVYVELCRKVKI